jgi:hypothetical protein
MLFPKMRKPKTPQEKLNTAMRQVVLAGVAQIRLGKDMDDLDTETAIYTALKNLLKEEKISIQEHEQLSKRSYTTARPTAD